MNDGIEFEPRGFGQADLQACSQCGALVAGEDRDNHRQWHKQRRREIAALLAAQALSIRTTP